VTLIAGCYGVRIGLELVLQEVSEIQGIKVFNNDEVLHSKAQYAMFF